MPSLYIRLFLFILIALEIVCIALMLSVALRLRRSVGVLLKSRKMQLDPENKTIRSNFLYLGRDNVKIGLYLGLDIFYVGISFVVIIGTSFALLHVSRLLR